MSDERRKQIDDACDRWEEATYDDYKDSYSFKEGARWADANPAPRLTGWQPIETLEKDKWVLVYIPQDDGDIQVQDLENAVYFGATHWMPLPEPPLKLSNI